MGLTGTGQVVGQVIGQGVGQDMIGGKDTICSKEGSVRGGQVSRTVGVVGNVESVGGGQEQGQHGAQGGGQGEGRRTNTVRAVSDMMGDVTQLEEKFRQGMNV